MYLGRRRFLAAASGLGAAGLVTGLRRAIADSPTDEAASAEGVSAPEDLMREHGVLQRLMLVYDEGVRRLRDGKEVPPDVFRKAATLVRRFVEDYHEKLEENFIFPAFEKQKQLDSLVGTLRQQHTAGRALTEVVLARAAPGRFSQSQSRQELAAACTAFNRMFRPHAPREDTVLFSALRGILSAAQVAELGEKFEDEEHRRFGPRGFEQAVDEVVEIEKQLGIYDLNQFTAKA